MSFQRAGGRFQANEYFRFTPVTMVILALLLVSFLGSILTNGALAELLAFSLRRPLPGLITAPLVIGRGDIIGLIFAGLMIFWFGGSLERSWGSRTYLLFLLVTNAAAIVLMMLGYLLLGALAGQAKEVANQVVIGSLWSMPATMIVAWAWLNPEETILLWFVLPLKAKWVGWLTILLLYFFSPIAHAAPGALFFVGGLFALGGVGTALLYVNWRRRWGWIPRPQKKAPVRKPIRHPASSPFAALLRPFREWQRRRRIARLQRSINIDDDIFKD